MKNKESIFKVICTVSLFFSICVARANEPSYQKDDINIQYATLGEKNQDSPEISTKEMLSIVEQQNLEQPINKHSGALIFDARTPLEYAISHIPYAINVSAKAGVSKSLYVSDVAEINRILQDKKSSAIVLYCNGVHCGKSKRLSKELIKDGYSNVKRYQLGIPVWRALGHATQTEADGAAYIFANDKTAIWIDARDRADFAKGSLPCARNLAESELDQSSANYKKDNKIIKRAKDSGLLPTYDHNTRIIVYGNNTTRAAKLAQILANKAFDNVSFFNGNYMDLLKAVNAKPSKNICKPIVR